MEGPERPTPEGATQGKAARAPEPAEKQERAGPLVKRLALEAPQAKPERPDKAGASNPDKGATADKAVMAGKGARERRVATVCARGLRSAMALTL